MSQFFHLLLVTVGYPFLILLAIMVVISGLRWWWDFQRTLDLVFLRVLIPRKDSKDDKQQGNDAQMEQFGTGKEFKKVTSIMVHLLQNLQVMHSKKIIHKLKGQDFFSLEYAVLDGLVYFYIVIPRHYKQAIEKQVSGFYKDAVVEQVPDYNIFKKGNVSASTAVCLEKKYAYPLKTFQRIETETINPIINALSKIALDEGAAIQLMLRPLNEGWQEHVESVARGVLDGKQEHGFLHYLNPFVWIIGLFRMLVLGKSEGGKDEQGGNKYHITQTSQDVAKTMSEKAQHVGFDTIIRIVASAPTEHKAEGIIQSIEASFKQFDDPNSNGFHHTIYHSNRALVRRFLFRSFTRGWLERFRLWKNGDLRMVLGAEEISSIYHLPDIRFNPATNIKWQDFKVVPAPSDLPSEGLLLGYNTYQGVKREIRILPDDRRRHFYLIGKSGTGKSTLLETMIKQDLANGNGCCVVDPHGDLVEAVLPYIPRSRADDVILFSPGDLERPLGLNMLEGKTPDEREFVAQEALQIFIKMFGEEIMGPRLQHYFRNGCLTLMDDEEEGATLIDLTRLFTDEAWQKYKVTKVKNPVVKSFWAKEMSASGQREKQEIIPYFNSKFGPFITNGQIRNIIGQVKSAFNIREAMDQRKILLCNLSKGKLGDLNAQLIGSILVAKIQMAAMSRVDTPEKERKDFFLYVDEFQNFVTESFASILSEARKYRLGLIVAHQYISQITRMSGGGKGTQENPVIKDAVFGNVGSMMCFKIGAADAEAMAKEFAPIFSDQDLINIANYKACIKLNIKGTTSRGFTLETIYDTAGKDVEAAEAMRQLSRLKYGRDREFVEAEIFKRVT